MALSLGAVRMRGRRVRTRSFRERMSSCPGRLAVQASNQRAPTSWRISTSCGSVSTSSAIAPKRPLTFRPQVQPKARTLGSLKSDNRCALAGRPTFALAVLPSRSAGCPGASRPPGSQTGS